MLHTRNLKRYALVMMLAVVAMAFSSCEEDRHWRDDPYSTGICGVWYLSYNNYGKVYSYDMDGWRFDADGTGTYNYWDDYGNWVYVTFEWESYDGYILDIYYDYGDTQRFTYDFDNYGYLVLYSGNGYWGYSYNSPDAAPSQSPVLSKNQQD